MILIKHATFTLVVKGHELLNSNKYGLVCCAVSAITNCAINCFAKHAIHVTKQAGYLLVHLNVKTFTNQIKWYMLLRQLYVLYVTYPHIIKWKGRKISWKN